MYNINSGRRKQMKTLKFKCTLLSDVILNQKAATEGPNKTLDFIPGSNFLGIVANELYDETINGEDAIRLFHSKSVRYGDAHPADPNKQVKGAKVPACMFYPKLKTPKEKLYIIHETDTQSKSIRELQLKQCRSGYYDFSDNPAVQIDTRRNFAIKSAHDRKKRTSEEAKMYGYESLEKGLVMYFDVEVDDDLLVDKIEKALEGKKNIGRSRSSQYGLVYIEKEEFSYVESKNSESNINVVYADSRLIFLDKNTGLPSFRPADSGQLGIEGGKILWDKCQIRTFQYSPWNFIRKCFDTDRCGIESGSVFVVEGGTLNISNYIGNYNNEGFGRVIYNPDFLKYKSDGEAEWRLTDFEKEKEKLPNENSSLPFSIVGMLKERQKKEKRDLDIYKDVNDWVKKNGEKFKSSAFASQWGKIRSLAYQGNILKRLSDGKDGYLMHGIGEEKWARGRKRELLLEFLDKYKEDDEKCCLVVINLAAEMAKYVGKEDNYEN